MISNTQEKFTIQVIAPSMGKFRSHDYWVRKAANDAIAALGYEALEPDTDVTPDIQLVFMGMPTSAHIRGRFKATWLYSKPGRDFPDEELDVFDQIYTLSATHQQKFEQKTGRKTKVLQIATDKYYKAAIEKHEYDIVYMATGVEYRAKVVRTLAEAGFRIGLVGSKWTKETEKVEKKPSYCLVDHPNIDIVEGFWPNEQFGDFYNKAPLSIYPMSETYVESGIVPIRILDVSTGSGCLCVVSSNPGLREVFANPPPTYDSLDEMIKLIRFYLDHPEERKIKQADVRQSLTRRYEDLVNDVINDAKIFWGQK